MDQIAQAFSSGQGALPGAAQPISGQELLLRALGAIANPSRAISVPDTTLGRLSGLLSRGAGGIASAKAEDLQRLRLDPVTRKLAIGQEALKGLQGLSVPSDPVREKVLGGLEQRGVSELVSELKAQKPLTTRPIETTREFRQTAPPLLQSQVQQSQILGGAPLKDFGLTTAPTAGEEARTALTREQLKKLQEPKDVPEFLELITAESSLAKLVEETSDPGEKANLQRSLNFLRRKLGGTEKAGSALGKLVEDRNRIFRANPNSPRLNAFEERIRREVKGSGGFALSTNSDGTFRLETGGAVGTGFQGKQIEQLTSINDVLSTIDDVESIMNVGNVGFIAKVRNLTFGTQEQLDAFGQFFTGLQRSVQADIEQFGFEGDTASFLAFDPSVPALDSLEGLLSYAVARANEPGSRLTDRDLRIARDIVGLGKNITGIKGVQARLRVLRRRFTSKGNVIRGLLGQQKAPLPSLLPQSTTLNADEERVE